MRLISTRCDTCGASIEIDLDHVQQTCPYCKSKLITDFDGIESVLREKEKTKRAVFREEEITNRMRMSYDYQERSVKQERSSKNKIVIGIIVLFVVLFAVIGIMEKSAERTHVRNNEIELTFSVDEVIGENYRAVEHRFKSLGFSDIRFIKNKDLVLALFNKDGEVELVTVNGSSSFQKGEWFNLDSTVVITYHAYKK